MPSPAPATRTSGATGREGVARWDRRAAALALLVVVGLGVGFEFRYVANADVAWLLTAGRRMTEGARLYSPALVEVNPPLVLELSAAAVHLEQWTSWPALSIWRGFVGVQALLLSWLSFRLLERLQAGRDRGAALLALAPLLAAAFTCLPSQDFGERDHLIAMWMTPGILVVAARLAGVAVPRGTALVAGALAGLAVCVKPQYLTVPAVLGLAALTTRPRRAHPELFAFIATGLAYAAYAAVAFPEYLSAGIPLALSVYAPQTSAWSKMVEPVHVLLIVGAVAGCAAAYWRGSRATAGPTMAIAGLAAYGVHLVARKGWTYQFLPAKIWLALAIGIVAVDLASRALAGRADAASPARRPSPLGAVVLLAAIAASAAWSTYRYGRHVESAHYRTTTRLLAAVPAGASMANLSPFLFPAFPLAEITGQRWGSRYSCLWMLPLTWRPDLLAYQSVAPGVRRDVAEGVAADLGRNRPRYVLLDRASTPQVLHVLADSAAFASAWQAYRLAQSVDGIDVYERRD